MMEDGEGETEDGEGRTENGESETEDGEEDAWEKGKGKGERARDCIGDKTSKRRPKGLMPGIFDNSSSYLAAISQRRLIHWGSFFS